APRIHRTGIQRDRTVASEMVGRREELETLASSVRRLHGGDGGVVAIRGEAGIGKSRPLGELRAADAPRDATILEGRSLAIGTILSFHPFVDLLQRWAGIAENATDVEARPKLEEAIRAAMPDAAADVFPFIATLMGLRVTGEDAACVES